MTLQQSKSSVKLFSSLSSSGFKGVITLISKSCPDKLVLKEDITVTKCFRMFGKTCCCLPELLWRLCCTLRDDCMVVDSGPPDTVLIIFGVECGFLDSALHG